MGGMAKAGIYLALIGITVILGSGLIANSILPLAVALTDTRFIIKTQSGSGISNARVDCYLHDFFGGVPSSPSYTVYSDTSGLAERTIAQGIYTVTVTASGYVVNTKECDNRASGEVNPVRSFTFTMVPGGTTPTGFDVDFYLLGANNNRVSAYVTCEGEAITSDEHGLARFNLEAGSHTIRFNGYYLKDTGGAFPTQMSFDFTKSVSISHATVYTVYLETESIQNANPPYEETDVDLTDLVAFLMASTIPGVPNWTLCLGALILLLVRGN
jgi:hypothetical protein